VGSYWYDPKEDALRVIVKPAKSEYHEWLTYEFTEREPAKATVALKWEELAVPVRIAVPNVNDLWVEDSVASSGQASASRGSTSRRRPTGASRTR